MCVRACVCVSVWVCACFLCDPVWSPVKQFVSMQGACVSLWCVSVCVLLLHGAFSQPPTESDTYTVRMDDSLSFPVFFIPHITPSLSDSCLYLVFSSGLRAVTIAHSFTYILRLSRIIWIRLPGGFSISLSLFSACCLFFVSHYLVLILNIIVQRLGWKKWLLSHVLCSHTSPRLFCRNAQMGTTGTLRLSTAKVTAPLPPFDLARFRHNSHLSFAPSLRCKRVRDHSRRLQGGNEML